MLKTGLRKQQNRQPKTNQKAPFLWMRYPPRRWEGRRDEWTFQETWGTCPTFGRIEVADDRWLSLCVFGRVVVQCGDQFPCPIRHTQMEELRSKKEDCHDTFLRFQEKSCPTFCNVKDYNYYYYGCREQGHSWFTLDYISRMVCGGGVTPTLSMSKSDKSYGKMYLRCPQRNCDLFQWLRFKTSKKTQQILCIDMEWQFFCCR